MDAAAALDEMRNNPDHFFRYYPVRTAGPTGHFAPGAANPKVVHLQKRDAGMDGMAPDQKEGHMGATRPGPLGFGTRNISSFEFDTMPTAYSVPVNVFGVPMVNYNHGTGGRLNLGGNVGALPAYHLGPGGYGYMITGQLSGCCFAWASVGGILWCCHVQPGGGSDPVAIEADMQANGHFATQPGLPLNLFGRNSYPAHATVIGVQAAGGWRLYAQNTVDLHRTITATWRLFPGPVVQL